MVITFSKHIKFEKVVYDINIKPLEEVTKISQDLDFEELKIIFGIVKTYRIEVEDSKLI